MTPQTIGVQDGPAYREAVPAQTSWALLKNRRDGKSETLWAALVKKKARFLSDKTEQFANQQLSSLREIALRPFDQRKECRIRRHLHLHGRPTEPSWPDRTDPVA